MHQINRAERTIVRAAVGAIVLSPWRSVCRMGAASSISKSRMGQSPSGGSSQNEKDKLPLPRQIALRGGQLRPSTMRCRRRFDNCVSMKMGNGLRSVRLCTNEGGLLNIPTELPSAMQCLFSVAGDASHDL